MLLVGPGLVAPSRLSEYWLYFFSLLIGGFFLMHLIASLTARHVTALSGSHGEYKGRMQDLEKYMDYHQFNPDHRQRMRVYYELKYPGGQYFGLTRMSNHRTPSRGAVSRPRVVQRRRGHPSRPFSPVAGGDPSAHLQRAIGQDAGTASHLLSPPALSALDNLYVTAPLADPTSDQARVQSGCPAKAVCLPHWRFIDQPRHGARRHVLPHVWRGRDR